jgi:hypothetical protein
MTDVSVSIGALDYRNLRRALIGLMVLLLAAPLVGAPVKEMVQRQSRDHDDRCSRALGQVTLGVPLCLSTDKP